MEFNITTLLIVGILALVSFQTFQLLTVMQTVNALSAGGIVSAAGAPAGSTSGGIGTC